jgi:hypothetical protein
VVVVVVVVVVSLEPVRRQQAGALTMQRLVAVVLRGAAQPAGAVWR